MKIALTSCSLGLLLHYKELSAEYLLYVNNNSELVIEFSLFITLRCLHCGGSPALVQELRTSEKASISRKKNIIIMEVENVEDQTRGMDLLA